MSLETYHKLSLITSSNPYANIFRTAVLITPGSDESAEST